MTQTECVTQGPHAPPLDPTPRLTILRTAPVAPVEAMQAAARPPVPLMEAPVDIPGPGLVLTPAARCQDTASAGMRSTTTSTPWRIITSRAMM